MGFRSEFKPSMVKLNHERAKDFAESPWMPWYILIIYRIILAVYCMGWIIYSGFHKANGEEKWFIFLTNWGYLFVTVYFVLSSVVTLWYHLKEKKQFVTDMEMEKIGSSPQDTERREETKYDLPPRRHHKALWVIYDVGANAAILITFLYWSLLAADVSGVALGLDISTHAFNSVFLLLELVLTSMPIRILHVIYPMIFAITYMLFSVIFWAAKGTNPINNNRYIYAVIDYSNAPGLAVGLFAGIVLVAMPLVQLFMYGMYRLREFVAGKYGRTDQR